MQNRSDLIAVQLGTVSAGGCCMNAKLETIQEPYKVLADGVQVCQDCFPGRTIVELFKDLANAKISHGLCLRHSARHQVRARVIAMAENRINRK